MYRIIIAAKSAPLYHGTTWENAAQIIESNELRANISNETETYGVSLTRNKEEAYSYVSIILDQEALSYNYKIEPVYRDGIAGRDLAEERIPRTIKNVRRYILGLQWNNPVNLRILRRRLVDNFGDPSVFTISDRYDKNRMISEVDNLIQIAHHYSIPLDSTFQHAEHYLQMFKEGVEDEEYKQILESRKHRR